MASRRKQTRVTLEPREAMGEFEAARGGESDGAMDPRDADGEQEVMMHREKSYFIVNPKGAIHEVDRAHAAQRLAVMGWRLATTEEIATYDAAGGNQRFDRPLAEPWTPLPLDRVEPLE